MLIVSCFSPHIQQVMVSSTGVSIWLIRWHPPLFRARLNTRPHLVTDATSCSGRAFRLGKRRVVVIVVVDAIPVAVEVAGLRRPAEAMLRSERLTVGDCPRFPIVLVPRPHIGVVHLICEAGVVLTLLVILLFSHPSLPPAWRWRAAGRSTSCRCA